MADSDYSFSATVESRIEKAKEKLRHVDKDLFKLTGREFNDYSVRPERRIRVQSGNRDDGHHLLIKPKQPAGVFARLGGVVSESRDHGGRGELGRSEFRRPEFGRGNFARLEPAKPELPLSRRVREVNDDDLHLSKPVLASSVALPVIDSKSRFEAASELTKDRASRDRNRRMFGALMGTLQQFKSDEARLKEKEEQRTAIERKLEQKGEAEREELRQERMQLFGERQKRQALIRKLHYQKMRVAQYEKWENHEKLLMEFIRTNTRPYLFWTPRIPHKGALVALSASREAISEEVERARLRLKEELDETLFIEERDDLPVSGEEHEGVTEVMDLNQDTFENSLLSEPEDGELVYDDVPTGKGGGDGGRMVVRVGEMGLGFGGRQVVVMEENGGAKEGGKKSKKVKKEKKSKDKKKKKHGKEKPEKELKGEETKVGKSGGDLRERLLEIMKETSYESVLEEKREKGEVKENTVVKEKMGEAKDKKEANREKIKGEMRKSQKEENRHTKMFQLTKMAEEEPLLEEPEFDYAFMDEDDSQLVVKIQVEGGNEELPLEKVSEDGKGFEQMKSSEDVTVAEEIIVAIDDSSSDKKEVDKLDSKRKDVKLGNRDKVMNEANSNKIDKDATRVQRSHTHSKDSDKEKLIAHDKNRHHVIAKDKYDVATKENKHTTAVMKKDGMTVKSRHETSAKKIDDAKDRHSSSSKSKHVEKENHDFTTNSSKEKHGSGVKDNNMITRDKHAPIHAEEMAKHVPLSDVAKETKAVADLKIHKKATSDKSRKRHTSTSDGSSSSDSSKYDKLKKGGNKQEDKRELKADQKDIDKNVQTGSKQSSGEHKKDKKVRELKRRHSSSEESSSGSDSSAGVKKAKHGSSKVHKIEETEQKVYNDKKLITDTKNALDENSQGRHEDKKIEEKHRPTNTKRSHSDGRSKSSLHSKKRHDSSSDSSDSSDDGSSSDSSSSDSDDSSSSSDSDSSPNSGLRRKGSSGDVSRKRARSHNDDHRSGKKGTSGSKSNSVVPSSRDKGDQKRVEGHREGEKGKGDDRENKRSARSGTRHEEIRKRSRR